MPAIVVIAGPHKGLRVEFESELSVGRDASCQLVLGQDDRVSRRHATLSLADGKLALRDLDSGNGTWAFGRFGRKERVSGERSVTEGDEFEVGSSRLRLEGTRPIPARPVPAGNPSTDCRAPAARSKALPIAGIAAGGTFSLLAVFLGATGGETSCGEAEAAAALRPSTVWVLALDQDGEVAQTGTGFVLRDDGYILTNRHVVLGSDEQPLPAFKVVFPGNERELPAQLVTFDDIVDLAMLKVAGTANFAPIQWGSATGLRDGDGLVAAGFPIPSDPSGRTIGDATFTFGRLSAKRQFQGAEFLQHDAEINPGNSGGPLADFCGRIVGVNTQVAYIPGQTSRAPGINYAISVADAKRLADQWLPLR